MKMLKISLIFLFVSGSACNTTINKAKPSGSTGADSPGTYSYDVNCLAIKDSVLYFTCDGKFRSKIGLSPLIARPMAASYDFQKNILTVIIPQVDKNADYVNSKWEIQKQPYKGDVINSYNAGPLADGTQMGPFTK